MTPVRPAVFLDRDDTLIHRAGGLPTGDLGDPADMEILPGVHEGLHLLKHAGYALIVVTNQGGVARGAYTLADVDRVHHALNLALDHVIDDFRACPYHPNGSVPEFAQEHPWRKPAPGMLLDAAAAHRLDLPRSWMIGDAERDVLAGKAAGCRGAIMVGDGAAAASYGVAPTQGALGEPTFREPDLLHAARRILAADATPREPRRA